mmetsp:Transcript_4895/g.8575  ORF Transcript_4895/g.8575 Transcript_4895/m.8575 type:complete len:83 (+) Transcript_4895:379-627(+)
MHECIQAWYKIQEQVTTEYSSITRELVLDYFGRKSEMINLIVVDLHHSDRNKNVLIIYHSGGVDMQCSLTFALFGAHQRAKT